MILNSVILSDTSYTKLGWNLDKKELESKNILFLEDSLETVNINDSFVVKLLKISLAGIVKPQNVPT